MQITYYAASSLDGYIAKENGDVSWLDSLNISPDRTGYEVFYATVDSLVMGRKTYDIIQSFGKWPYGNKPTWVCTHSSIKPIAGARLQTETSPNQVVVAAKQMGLKHLWLVGGGLLASAFLEQSLLTNILIVYMPIVLGNGIPLFGPISAPSMPRSLSHYAVSLILSIREF